METKKMKNHADHENRVSSPSQQEEGVPYLNTDGEVYVLVYAAERRVCELVWEAFNGDIPKGFKVTHIDGDKQNNRLDNLKLERL